MLNYIRNRYLINTYRDTPSEIVIITGAGISQESGLPIFNENGFYIKREVFEKVAFKNSFLNYKTDFIKFYKNKRKLLKQAFPNKAHEALVFLEKEYKTLIVSQNIDDLHEKAGSNSLFKIFGSLLDSRCNNCGFISNEDIGSSCVKCDIGKNIPSIVLIGEDSFLNNEIEDSILKSKLVIQVGCSNRMEPISSLIKNTEGFRININTNRGIYDNYFDINIYGKASLWLPLLVRRLIKNKKKDL